MKIRYIEPLSQGIARTKRELFKPLDVKKWFVIGFTAFLAGLADVGFPGGDIPNLNIGRRSNIDLEAVLYFPQRAWEWLGNHSGWATVIVFGLFVFFVFMIVITWLSSRGKFMFLDNVVWGRSRIAAPWREYRDEANSFFGFNILWVVVFFVIILAYIFYCFLHLQALYESSGNGRALIWPAILAGVGFLVISLFSSFIFVLIRDFAIPIMYRDRSTIWQAIQKLTPLFLSQIFYFIGYGIFLFCLGLLIAIGIIFFGCCTCCIGFLILAIPYINAVVLLPIAYAMRAFSVEFLEQFGPEYQIFPRPEINPPDAQPVTA